MILLLCDNQSLSTHHTMIHTLFSAKNSVWYKIWYELCYYQGFYYKQIRKFNKVSRNKQCAGKLTIAHCLKWYPHWTHPPTDGPVICMKRVQTYCSFSQTSFHQDDQGWHHFLLFATSLYVSHSQSSSTDWPSERIGWSHIREREDWHSQKDSYLWAHDYL